MCEPDVDAHSAFSSSSSMCMTTGLRFQLLLSNTACQLPPEGGGGVGAGTFGCSEYTT